MVNNEMSEKSKDNIESWLQEMFPRLAFNVQSVGSFQLNEASNNGSTEVNQMCLWPTSIQATP